MGLIKGYTNGEAKDKVLERCLKSYNEEKEYFDSVASVMIKSDIFPESHILSIAALITKIESFINNQTENNEPSIVDIYDVGSDGCYKIMANEFTQRFLDEGGFTAIEKAEKRVQEKEEIEFEKSKIDLELAKRMLKDYPATKRMAKWGFGIAVLSIIFAAISLFWD